MDLLVIEEGWQSEINVDDKIEQFKKAVQAVEKSEAGQTDTRTATVGNTVYCEQAGQEVCKS